MRDRNVGVVVRKDADTKAGADEWREATGGRISADLPCCLSSVTAAVVRCALNNSGAAACGECTLSSVDPASGKLHPLGKEGSSMDESCGQLHGSVGVAKSSDFSLGADTSQLAANSAIAWDWQDAEDGGVSGDNKDRVEPDPTPVLALAPLCMLPERIASCITCNCWDIASMVRLQSRI